MSERERFPTWYDHWNCPYRHACAADAQRICVCASVQRKREHPADPQPARLGGDHFGGA